MQPDRAAKRENRDGASYATKHSHETRERLPIRQSTPSKPIGQRPNETKLIQGLKRAQMAAIWVYDLRTIKHFTQKQSPITRRDFDEFVECYQPGAMHKRKPTWSEETPDGRWRCYDYEDLLKRDKLSLDLFWVKDKTLTDTDSLPAPDILAAEIADELETAFDQFTKIAAKLRKNSPSDVSGTKIGQELSRIEGTTVAAARSGSSS